jgi:hypothetical protein
MRAHLGVDLAIERVDTICANLILVGSARRIA